MIYCPCYDKFTPNRTAMVALPSGQRFDIEEV